MEQKLSSPFHLLYHSPLTFHNILFPSSPPHILTSIPTYTVLSSPLPHFQLFRPSSLSLLSLTSSTVPLSFPLSLSLTSYTYIYIHTHTAIPSPPHSPPSHPTLPQDTISQSSKIPLMALSMAFCPLNCPGEREGRREGGGGWVGEREGGSAFAEKGVDRRE